MCLKIFNKIRSFLSIQINKSSDNYDNYIDDIVECMEW